MGWNVKMNLMMKKKMNLSKRINGSRSDGGNVNVDNKDGFDHVSNAAHCVEEMHKGKRMDVLKQGWWLYFIVGGGRNEILDKRE